MTIGTPSYKGYKFHKFPIYPGTRLVSQNGSSVTQARGTILIFPKAIDFLTNLDETQQKKNLIF